MKQVRFRTFSLLPNKDMRERETNNDISLGASWYMALEEGKGRLRFQQGDVPTLTVQPYDVAPSWIEMRWISKAKELAGFRQILLQMSLSASKVSIVHPAIRLNSKTDFRDIFAEPVPLSSEVLHCERSIGVPVENSKSIAGINLHLFFEKVPNDINFHSVSLVGLKG